MPLSLLLLSGTALAKSGAVVHLVAGDGQSAPFVAYFDEEGVGSPSLQCFLKDDGKAPDVIAGDGFYSGSVLGLPPEAGVLLVAGEHRYGPLPLSIPADTEVLDIFLSLENGELQADIRQGKSPPLGGGLVAGGSLPPDLAVIHRLSPERAMEPLPTQFHGDLPSPPLDPPAAAKSSNIPIGEESAPILSGSAAGSDAVSLAAEQARPRFFLQRILAGAGYFSFCIAGLAWLRKEGHLPTTEPTFAPLEPKDLLGPGSPALHGLCLLPVGPDDREVLLGSLLRRISHRRRVLLVSEEKPEPVHGGPVFHTGPSSPFQTFRIADRLSTLPGPPLVLILVEPGYSTSQWERFSSSLPPGLQCLALVDMSCGASGRRFSYHSADGEWVIGER
jgi:hypothetical protein